MRVHRPDEVPTTTVSSRGPQLGLATLQRRGSVNVMPWNDTDCGAAVLAVGDGPVARRCPLASGKATTTAATAATTAAAALADAVARTTRRRRARRVTSSKLTPGALGAAAWCSSSLSRSSTRVTADLLLLEYATQLGSATQPRQRLRRLALHGADGAAEDGHGLCFGQVVEEPQDHHRPLPAGERPPPLTDRPADRGPPGRRPSGWPGGRRRRPAR